MNALVIAAAVVRFLDPWTSVVQTDDTREGLDMSWESGYWPVPCGLWTPLAPSPSPRVVHACFKLSDAPFKEYDPEKPSPLFKVNQVGYLPGRPKFAYFGAWLGPVYGAWKPKATPASWELVDAHAGGTVASGEGANAPKLRIRDAMSKEGVLFTGEETYEIDFSAFDMEGEYFLRVPGVGRSENFKISKDAAVEAFRIHMLGLYQKRCGIAKTEPWTHWTSGACHKKAVRGVYPSEEGKLEPKVKWFDIIRDTTDWSGEAIEAEGGWHDAADYDRRPWHLNIVNDLCAVYLARPDNFCDGQLSIPESANSIPDILDEAEWGLRHLLAVQQSDGGVGTWIETVAHPAPGSDAATDTMRYAISGPTRRSSMMYAAHAALLARTHPSFKEKYLDSAVRAWNFAVDTAARTEKWKLKSGQTVEWREDADLPPGYTIKAAINLSALTGDGKYIEKVLAAGKTLADAFAKEGWSLPPLMFTGERALGMPDVMAGIMRRWETSKVNMAKGIVAQMESAYAYRAPWWGPREGWVHAMGTGHSHPLVRAQYLVAAHQITGENKYLDAISLAMDFHNGCNPQGSTLTSALGKIYPVAFLDLPSYVDGIAEYVPGITPYRWTYSLPWKAVEKVWRNDKRYASRWPIWRRWGNLETLTPGASEYTVWETIAPAASVCAYMMSGSDAPPFEPPKPAADIRNLPGYWVLP